MLRLLLKNRVLALMDRFAGRKRGKKATSTGRIVLFSLLGLALLVMIGAFLASLIYPLFDAFSQEGLTWLFFALVGCATVLASFMMTMFYAQGAIFEAKDNELLLSMPIPPSAILGSRLGALYLLNLLVAVIIMGAAGTLHIFINGASVIGVVILVLSILLLALISTTLSCLLGWLVSLLGMAIGLVLGVLLVWAQQRWGLVPMPGHFIVTAYPVVLQASDIIWTVVGVAGVGFLMAFLPSRKLS